MVRYAKDDRIFFLASSVFLLLAGIAFLTEQYLLIVVPFTGLIFYAGWQYSNAAFFLLLLSIPFSTEYSLSPYLSTDLPDEPLMVFISGLFLAYWIYSPRALTKEKITHPLILLLALLLLWSVTSSFFSSHPLLSLKYLLAKTWYTGAFIIAPLIIFNNQKNLAAAAIILAVALVAVAVIALVRHYSYGFRFANINDAVSPFFRNHVNYSAMLVCSVPLLLAIYKYSAKKLVIAGALLAVLTALFFSYARGAWLALIAGGAAWWLIKKRLLLYAYIAAVTIVAGTVGWLQKNDNYLRYSNDFKTTIFHKDFSEHLIATYKLKDVSTAERFYRWVAGVNMIQEHPLTGFGPNTFYYHYKEYAVPAFKTWVSSNEEHSTVHNYFLLTITEQGIPALILLLLLFGALLYYSQHLYHCLPEGIYRTASITTGVIVVMIITVNFLSDLIETDKVGSLFFLCIATLTVVDINGRKSPGSDLSPHI